MVIAIPVFAEEDWADLLTSKPWRVTSFSINNDEVPTFAIFDGVSPINTNLVVFNEDGVGYYGDDETPLPFLWGLHETTPDTVWLSMSFRHEDMSGETKKHLRKVSDTFIMFIEASDIKDYWYFWIGYYEAVED